MRTIHKIFSLSLIVMIMSCNAQKNTFAPEIGVCTSVKNNAEMAELGMDYIEDGVRRFLIPTKSEEKFQENMAILKKSKLKIWACNGFLPGSLKSVGPETKHDEIIEFTETAFRRAKEAGIKYIVFGSSGSRRVPEGFSKEEAKKQFVALLKRMGPIGAKYGVKIVIEPLRRGEVNFVNTVAEGLEIAKLVNHPNIRLLADFYHMKKNGEGPEAIIEAGDILEHCHIAEKEKRALPGMFNDDFKPFLDALKQINYKGKVSFESGYNRKDNYRHNLVVAKKYVQDQIKEIL